MNAREGEQAVEKAIEPAGVARGGYGESEGEKCRERSGSHGSEIGEAAGQGAVADGGRGVPGAAKVAAFEAEVGGDEEFVAGRRGEDGAVVADAEADGAGGCGAGTDALDEEEFTGGLFRGAGFWRVRHRFQSTS